jgi:hypothetical protein
MSPLTPGWRFVVIVPFIVVSVIESAGVIPRKVRWTPRVLLPIMLLRVEQVSKVE